MDTFLSFIIKPVFAWTIQALHVYWRLTDVIGRDKNYVLLLNIGNRLLGAGDQQNGFLNLFAILRAVAAFPDFNRLGEFLPRALPSNMITWRLGRICGILQA